MIDFIVSFVPYGYLYAKNLNIKEYVLLITFIRSHLFFVGWKGDIVYLTPVIRLRLQLLKLFIS